LQQASAAAHQTVSDFERDFYERRAFDPYLRFASAEDEEAYRRREADRKAAIDRAMAERTPEGNLRANRLALDQLEDAGAHGADRSPEYLRTHDRLMATRDALTRAITSAPSAAISSSQPTTATTADPLQSIAAKAPDAKGVAAALLAAGISPPASDNVGHGVQDRVAQPASAVRST
jgi:hypothetical protein